MAVIVVGGQTRGVGKTSVVCSLIVALRERQWTAVKLSSHGHSDGVEVREELSAGSDTDSARYLAAGAVQSFYISVPEGSLWRAVPRVLDILAGAANAMVESTSVLAYLRPELALAVVDPAAGEVKKSLQRLMARFDAVVTPREGPLGWLLQELDAKPRFVIRPPEYGSEDLSAFVREMLGNKTSAP
jgi:hypothetical protein